MEYAIIGAGPQGVAVARALKDVGKKDIALIDAANEPFAVWKRRTAQCGMNYLRSPAAHHLGDDSEELLRFGNYWPSNFLGERTRPSLALFNKYCAKVWNHYGLEEHFIPRRRVLGLTRNWRSFTIDTDYGRYKAKNVILAVGPTVTPNKPRGMEAFSHVYDPDFSLDEAIAERKSQVIGGGIGAGQVAIALANAGIRVRLSTRKKLVFSNLDADKKWAQPEGVDHFNDIPHIITRALLVDNEKRYGTLPDDIYDGVLTHSKISVEVGERTNLFVDAKRTVLATGFRRVTGIMEKLAHSLSLPLYEGNPILDDRTLAWDSGKRWFSPRIYVTGAHAELSLGPFAGNLRGAQFAAARISGINSHENCGC